MRPLKTAKDLLCLEGYQRGRTAGRALRRRGRPLLPSGTACRRRRARPCRWRRSLRSGTAGRTGCRTGVSSTMAATGRCSAPTRTLRLRGDIQHRIHIGCGDAEGACDHTHAGSLLAELMDLGILAELHRIGRTGGRDGSAGRSGCARRHGRVRVGRGYRQGHVARHRTNLLGESAFHLLPMLISAAGSRS
jgi:hypothetical protein